MQKLINYQDEFIGRGNRLRFSFSNYSEPFVDLMVFDNQDRSTGMGLIVVSGHKSGLISIVLPVESGGPDKSRAIQTKWLIDNWSRWIDDTSPVEKVYVLSRQPVPDMPSN